MAEINLEGKMCICQCGLPAGVLVTLRNGQTIPLCEHNSITHYRRYKERQGEFLQYEHKDRIISKEQLDNLRRAGM